MLFVLSSAVCGLKSSQLGLEIILLKREANSLTVFDIENDGRAVDRDRSKRHLVHGP